MKLIIAEKPSVAQTIAAALGVKKRRDGYLEGDDMLISWCFGHLAGLADASIYDLSGRKVSKTPRRGIVIRQENGKFRKVINK